ncbi:MAG TPA: membrane protein insertase YidC [Bryobacteraceae bacterium]|nr:membrane protein insertase YidC [Bryobacteraceae bacterium]
MDNSSKDPVPSSGPPSKTGGGLKKAFSKEMSMEVRLVITFVLMGLVLFLTPYVMKNTAPPPPLKKAELSAVKPEAPKESKPQPSAAVPALTPEAPAGQITETRQDDNIRVDTDLYSVQFSNRGAVVRSWVLRKYPDANKKPVELVNPVAGEHVGFPFAMVLKGVQLTPDPNQSLYAVKRSPDGLGVEFEFSDGKVHSKKSFQFAKSRYLVQVSSEVREQGRPVPHLISWRGGFGDFTVANTLATQHVVYFDTAENKLVANDASVAKNGPVSVNGRYHFAGVEDTYFAALSMPLEGATAEVQTWSDKLPFAAEANKEQPHAGVAIGGDGINKTAFYVGPKDLDILRGIDPKMEQLVDFGWFWFLAKPLFVALNYVNDRYIHNYGWSIIVVTVLINILLMPLKISNIKSMKKMSQLQPQIKSIQDKYTGMSLKDPRRQQQQTETMELYKRHGVNPLGGCVPMALQLPFFFAFYKVLTLAIEMRGAQWLWVTDLSQPESLAIRILPLATIATQFVMQKMTPNTTADPQQQKIMMFMPLMFIFIFYSVASGLVLYWLTGNVVGIAQQYFFNKTMGTTAPVPKKLPEPRPKKKS